MSRAYHIRVTQVTNATKGNLLDMSKRVIASNDFLTIFACTDLVADILKELAAELVSEYGKDTVKKRVRVKVLFAYRKIRPQIMAAFDL